MADELTYVPSPIDLLLHAHNRRVEIDFSRDSQVVLGGGTPIRIKFGFPPTGRDLTPLSKLANSCQALVIRSSVPSLLMIDCSVGLLPPKDVAAALASEFRAMGLEVTGELASAPPESPSFDCQDAMNEINDVIRKANTEKRSRGHLKGPRWPGFSGWNPGSGERYPYSL